MCTIRHKKYVFRCPLCEKLFSRRDTIREHVRRVHDGLRYNIDTLIDQIHDENNPHSKSNIKI